MEEDSYSLHCGQQAKNERTERKRLGLRYTLERHSPSDPLPPISYHLS
jgi:hypothetical protein